MNVFAFRAIPLVIPFLACLATLGCGKVESPAKLRVGYLPVAAELPLFVALEQGYFKEAGLDVELIRFASSNEMGNAATADKIDILAGAASNVVFDVGSISGKRHRLFCINPYSNRPGHITDHLIARKGSGITKLEQIKGKKLASFPGSANKILCNLILAKYGIPKDSYEYIELLPKDWAPALQSGQIDALSALEPSATQIIKDSVGESIFPGFYADMMPDLPLSAHWIAADYLGRADKRTLGRFLDAYEKAVDYCRKDISAAKRYLPKYANVREDILDQVNVNPWTKLSEIQSDKVQAYIDLLFANGGLQKQVSAKDFQLADPRL